jgi:ABC-type glycerol-3-phosphate transport system substrate-binding protein
VNLRPLAALAIVAAACAGCSSADSATAESDGGFPAAPFASLTSTSGALAVDFRFSPQPPPRGIIEAEITVTRASDGSPVDGLMLAILPWMPAMNHGAINPTITPEGGGKYLVTELDLFMPGLWQLKTTVSGPLSDNVSPEFEVP